MVASTMPSLSRPATSWLPTLPGALAVRRMRPTGVP
jgi:hypothetical protein